MPIDNALYDRLSHTWWDDSGFLNILQTALNPARVGFLMRELGAHAGEVKGLNIVDVGCGGGLLAEELAGAGANVIGVDPSEASLAAAREHAHGGGLKIDYRSGVAEDVPVEDGWADAVVCCDVLEHVDDAGKAVAEAARVLRPGGVYLYDTINRTRRSKLLMIKVFQEWPSTACMEPDLHDHAMFITPTEIDAFVRRAGLTPGPTHTGIAPGIAPPKAIALLRARAKGKLGYGDLGRALRMRECGDLSGLYTGTAVKPIAS
jgi:2-polyprenyl-6-hydroxyphenyl methylase/3-demethylubiquinone-9 3-methyltransferase